MIRIHRFVMWFGLLFFPAAGWCQTEEQHEVEVVERTEVGPYEPEKTPDQSEVEAGIVKRTNEFRVQKDLEPVEVDQQLKKTAQDFAGYMARTDRYGHQADDRSAAARAKAHDYKVCLVLENIAYAFTTEGFATAKLQKELFTGWKQSPGHRRNMLNPYVTQTGVGLAQSDKTGVFYAVQLFGRPRSQAIEFRLANPLDQKVRYRIRERTFNLPPLYARTHELCRPATVQLLAVSDEDGDEDKDTETQQDEEPASVLEEIQVEEKTKLQLRRGDSGQPAFATPDAGDNG